MKRRNKEELLVEAIKSQKILKDIQDLKDILTDEDKQEIDNICDKFEDWSDRLSDNRYRVAIIGTEKAGKSTFANALLRRDILPEDEGRCTFTTTTIESSETEDSAEIQFFSLKEFKEKFNNLCQEVQFKSNYNRATLIDLDKFCEAEPTKATHNSVDDIRDIIKKKDKIEKYLTGKIHRGLDIEKVKPYITDEIKARAVKKIIIKSTQFKGQKDLIIYDVPGFDSPTKLHLEQAKWYMRNADIVIMLVSIADRVSFVKAQADFLNETKDRYGQNLSNKLIVVASKFDKHIVDDKRSSNDKIDKSYKILINELKKYNLYKANNIFKTSALGFLEEQKIVDTQYSYKNLQKHNYDNGIFNIEERLQKFLNGEALEILNENFTRDQVTANKIIFNFKENYNPQKDQQKKRTDEVALIDEKWDSISSEIKSNMTKYQKKIKESNFVFDDKIATQVTNHWIEDLKNKLEMEIETEKSNITGGRADVVQATKVNDGVRQNIYKESLSKIVNLSTDIITDENRNQENEILDIVSKIIFDTKDITSVEREELQSILDSLTKDFKYDAKSYKPLILRFLNNVFEILILNRVTDNERDTRVERFEKLRPDIESLLNYDDKHDDTLGFYNQELIKLLLIQNIKFEVKESNVSGILKGAKVAMQYDEVIEEINTDLDSLGLIFNNILLKAINIEAPFKSSINDQVQSILNDTDMVSRSQLRKFITWNIESIANSEYSKLEVDENLADQINDIIEQIDMIAV